MIDILYLTIRGRKSAKKITDKLRIESIQSKLFTSYVPATSSGVFSAIDGAEFTGEDAAGGGGAGAEEADLLLDPVPFPMEFTE